MCAASSQTLVAAQRTRAALVELLRAIEVTLFYVGVYGLDAARRGQASGQLQLLLAGTFVDLELAQANVEETRTLLD